MEAQLQTSWPLTRTFWTLTLSDAKDSMEQNLCCSLAYRIDLFRQMAGSEDQPELVRDIQMEKAWLERIIEE